MSTEQRITRKIKQTMQKKAVGYRTLAEKTGIHEARLKRSLNIWSAQSLTLSDLDAIYKALGITDDLSAYDEFTALSDEAKMLICQMIKMLREQT
jgi:DNA-binding Xre family transcriptional regulator